MINTGPCLNLNISVETKSEKLAATKGTHRTSVVWEHFQLLESKKVKCKLCTTSIKNHLSSHHPSCLLATSEADRCCYVVHLAGVAADRHCFFPSRLGPSALDQATC